MGPFYIPVSHCKNGLSLNLNWYQLFSVLGRWGEEGEVCSLFDYRPLSLDFCPTPLFYSHIDPWTYIMDGAAPKKEAERNELQQWKNPANVMQIYYESSQKYKFTTLWLAYKIAICLTVCATLMYSKPWVLSISVSQIIQTFKGKVNIKCCPFHNMQLLCLFFLLPAPVWSRNT